MPLLNEGDLLGNNRYVIAERLGKGGMATVYRAYDTRGRMDVAVKQFDVAEKGRIAKGSYAVEIRSLKELKHENIVQLLDDGADQHGNPYLVLELMDRDLHAEREKNKGNAYEWKSFYELVGKPLLAALEFGHDNGIVHRDIQPRNVLISDANKIKLADFGIARIKGRLNAGMTLREYRTEPYAPPEPDDGEYLNGRDVFAFGALFVWAMTEPNIVDYGDLFAALPNIDVPNELRRILAKCLSREREERYQTASLLKIDLDAVWRQHDATQLPKRSEKVRIQLNPKAMTFLTEKVAMDPATFFEQDVNSTPTISRYTQQREPVPNHFILLGARMSYHVAFNDDRSEITVLNATEPDPGTLLRNKDRQPHIQVSFTLNRLAAGMKAADLFDLFDESINQYHWEVDGTEDDISDIIRHWRTILDAKYEIEERRQPPIDYDELSLEGRVVSVRVEDTAGFNEKDRWMIKSDGLQVPLVVEQKSESEVVFTFATDRTPSRLPQSGKLLVDVAGTKRTLDRQQRGLEVMTARRSVNRDLRELLEEPAKITIPDGECVPLSFDNEDIDVPKQNAIRAVLQNTPLVLVPGPPGTGKTRFIAFLIKAFKEHHKRGTVLLAAQTHVAVDNALEVLAKNAPGIRILRISNTGDVPDSSKRFLFDRQMEGWKTLVEKESDQWIRAWAEQNEVDADNILLGVALKELATLKDHLTPARAELNAAVRDRQTIARSDLISGADQEDLAAAALREQQARDRFDRLKFDIATLETRIPTLRYGDESCREVSTNELHELADAFIGNSTSDANIKSALALRTKWLAVFGIKPLFNAALCERSDVVAGTCIGFAGLQETETVEYDLCIIDEASKATALEALVPMVRAKQWVLVGDSRQLPPFRESGSDIQPVLQERNLDVDSLSESLFPMLESTLPADCIHPLSINYRMNQPIGTLISNCFYSGDLNAGTRAPESEIVREFGASILWISTSSYSDRKESPSRTSWVNHREKSVIVDQLRKLNDIAEGRSMTVLVISSYMAQVVACRDEINANRTTLSNLTISCETIDAVQGKEADAVVYSLTRTPPTRFVDDKHRVNVALSRGCELLVVVGDDEAIRECESCDQLSKLLRYMDSNPKTCQITKTTQLFGYEI